MQGKYYRYCSRSIRYSTDLNSENNKFDMETFDLVSEYCTDASVASPIKCGRVILRRICSRRFRVTPKGAVAPKDSSCTVSVKWIPVPSVTLL